jgi:predicted transcriptional regulator
MKTWTNYKNHVKAISPEDKKSMEDIENLADIIGAMIDKRSELGISQRDLAAICGMPQSSVARIESFKTTPNLDTLLRILRPLGLKLTVASTTK